MKVIRRIAISVLVASFVSSSLSLTRFVKAQQPAPSSNTKLEKSAAQWPVESGSVVSRSSEKADIAPSNEPVMRIALSTGMGGATISTTARLLSVSEFTDEAQPLDATRVRVESRMLTPSRQLADHAYDLEIARSLPREDADRLIESIRQTAGE